MIRIPFIYNLRSMTVRWSSTLVAVLGIAGVVAVFLATLSMARGFRETMKSSGAEDNALVLRGGATSEIMSFLPLEHARIVGDAAGVAHDVDGNPLMSIEVVMGLPLTRRDTGQKNNVLMRGVSQQALAVHDTIKVIQGRFFKPGLAELVVGKSISTAYKDLHLGGTISFSGQTWTVVGIFDAGGTSAESAIWCDANLLNQAFKRRLDVFQSVTVKLGSPEAFSRFKDTLTSDPRLYVKVERESTYYENQSKGLTTLIKALGFLVAFVMGIGAVFAALNTMYASVSARASEIATLRALGFSGRNVIMSFLLESMSIALLGGILGSFIILPLNGFAASTFSMSTFSQVAFAFMITPDLMVQGLVFALVMGFFGGLFPAVHAARQSIAGTLRGM